MKTLTTLAFITLTGALFGVTNTFAGDVPSQSINVRSEDVTFYDLAQSLAPKTTPNGYCGALNMIMNWAVKAIGMSHDADQGDAGMYHAIEVSDCQ